MLEIKRKPKAAAAENPATDRDYRAMFRAAYTFHAQHRPNLGADYWAETVKDITRVLCDFNQDPLLMDLLHAIYTDLEREYKHMLEELNHG